MGKCAPAAIFLLEEKFMAQSAFDELKWRGLVYDTTESVPEMLARRPGDGL